MGFGLTNSLKQSTSNFLRIRRFLNGKGLGNFFLPFQTLLQNPPLGLRPGLLSGAFFKGWNP